MNKSTCSRCGLPAEKKSRRINHPSPYAAHFQIEASMYRYLSAKVEDDIRSFVCAVENELIECDADIARVEDLLHRLKEERQAGQSFLTQHRRIIIHIHVLPPEIMLNIFRHCLDESLPPFNRPGYSLQGSRKPIPWILSAVCHRWRNILHDSPSYWSTLDVSMEQPFATDVLGYRQSKSSLDVSLQQPFLDDALRLSRRVPLHFSLDLGRADLPNPCIQSLVKHVSRWESIHVSGPQDTFVTLGITHLGDLPNLKKLSISLHMTSRGRIRDDVIENEIIDLTAALSPFSICPQLHELSISMQECSRQCPSVLQTAALPFPWGNLSKLTVFFGTHSTHIVRSLLLACPSLCQLVVFGNTDILNPEYHGTIDIGPVPTHEPLVHSSITSLTVNYPLDLLKHTKYPALTHFFVANATPRKLVEFLSQYHYSISHFTLLPCEIFELPLDWDSVFCLLQDVVHLTVPRLKWRSISQSLITRLPKLQTLVLYTQCGLLEFCTERSEMMPVVVSRWSSRTLQTLEVYCHRTQDWKRDLMFTKYDPIHKVPLSDLPGMVSQRIEASATMKKLLALKEEGLEININDIPLTDRSVTLYM